MPTCGECKWFGECKHSNVRTNPQCPARWELLECILDHSLLFDDYKQLKTDLEQCRWEREELSGSLEEWQLDFKSLQDRTNALRDLCRNLEERATKAEAERDKTKAELARLHDLLETLLGVVPYSDEWFPARAAAEEELRDGGDDG